VTKNTQEITPSYFLKDVYTFFFLEIARGKPTMYFSTNNGVNTIIRDKERDRRKPLRVRNLPAVKEIPHT
jgi:hypothetical protein